MRIIVIIVKTNLCIVTKNVSRLPTADAVHKRSKKRLFWRKENVTSKVPKL